jgi:hypothetical protein
VLAVLILDEITWLCGTPSGEGEQPSRRQGAGSGNADNQITLINAISRIDRRTRVDLSFAFVIEFDK